MTAKQIANNEVARRRGNFERHVASCEDCQPTQEDSVNPASFCMSGAIMLRHYFNAIVATRKES